MSFDPESKAGKCCGYGGHRKSQAFKRCISPGLIIGGKNSQIETDQQIVIGCIEDSIVTIEVGRHKEYLNLVFGTVVKTGFFYPVQDWIPFSIMQIVGEVF